MRMVAHHVSRVARHASLFGRLLHHRQKFNGMALAVFDELFPGVLRHLGLIGKYMELRDHMQACDLGLNLLGELNALFNRGFGRWGTIGRQ